MHQKVCDSNIRIAKNSYLGITQMPMNSKTDKLWSVHKMDYHMTMRMNTDNYVQQCGLLSFLKFKIFFLFFRLCHATCGILVP